MGYVVLLMAIRFVIPTAMYTLVVVARYVDGHNVSKVKADHFVAIWLLWKFTRVRIIPIPVRDQWE